MVEFGDDVQACQNCTEEWMNHVVDRGAIRMNPINCQPDGSRDGSIRIKKNGSSDIRGYPRIDIIPARIK